MRKVLIANRGEIAVRVARACRDAGIASVAVYAEPDGTLHVRAADEAFALGGDTPATSYLDIAKVLQAAKDSGADAIPPGLRLPVGERRVRPGGPGRRPDLDRPAPQAIRDLGDKVAARHIAQRAGAPLVAGTPDPVSGADEVVAFAREHGLPIAIKAAFGGGGRGLKVARTLEEVPELYDSAVREAVAAFGRGECFVERYLDKPRHVETQILADTHGNVVVVSTRDCSLQRRHQKLVEEAPARSSCRTTRSAELYSSSKAILKEAGYVGAGTVEFLVGMDGTISFLEVNTRLQVEHPVTEEVAGIDLVREMFRIADGEELGYGDPALRGHSYESRINGEDPGRNFLPAPGTVTLFAPPSGPGVRLDAGVESGSVIGPAWDSLLAKLIVTGATREQALQRAARALGVPGRGHGDRHPVPPRGRQGPGIRSRTDRFHRPVHGPHPLDRDRVRQRDPRVHGPRRTRRPTRSRAARRSSSRSAASASRSRCRPRWACPSPAPASPPAPSPSAARPRSPARSPPVTRSPRPCRARSSRSRSRRARRSRRATSSSSWRP